MAVQEEMGFPNSTKDLEFVVIPVKTVPPRKESKSWDWVNKEFLYMIKMAQGLSNWSQSGIGMEVRDFFRLLFNRNMKCRCGAVIKA